MELWGGRQRGIRSFLLHCQLLVVGQGVWAERGDSTNVQDKDHSASEVGHDQLG